MERGYRTPPTSTGFAIACNPTQFQLHAEIEERHWWFVARRQILYGAGRTRSCRLRTKRPSSTSAAAPARIWPAWPIDTSASASMPRRRPFGWRGTRFPQVRFIHGLAPRDLGSVHGAHAAGAVDRRVGACRRRLCAVFRAAGRRSARHVLSVDRAGRSASVERARPDRSATIAATTWIASSAFGKIWPVQPLFASHFNSRLYPAVKLVRQLESFPRSRRRRRGYRLQLPSRPLTPLLTNCFAGERHRLVRLAKGERMLAISIAASA